MRWTSPLCLCLLAVLGCETPKATVGPIDANRSLLPTGQIIQGYGDQLAVNGRPTDALLSADGNRLFVKDIAAIRVVDTGDMKELQSVELPGHQSMTGLALSPDGSKLYATSAENQINVYDVSGESVKLEKSIVIPAPDGKGPSLPCGVAISLDGRTAYVALSLLNTLSVVDLDSGEHQEIPVGVAPFAVKLIGDRAYVTNLGGSMARPRDHTAPSAGTQVKIDRRGIPNTGTISVVDLPHRRRIAEIRVGLSPSIMQLLPDGKTLAVCNANSDSVSWVDVEHNRELFKLNVKPDARLPFGSMPNGLTVSRDGRTLYVADAGNNALAVVNIQVPRSPEIEGFVPTDWYPLALTTGFRGIFVVNNKGVGSRAPKRAPEKGHNTHDNYATIRRFLPPTKQELASLTQTVMQLLDAPQILAAEERKGNSRTTPTPIPAKLGDPSTIQHVIYVIKENRTYDQIFGDMKEGDGKPELCTFGEEVTPNEHALARQFVLLDNFYCNGVLSADGHAWAIEGNLTPYLNRSWDMFQRSYSYGTDAITYSSSGFIWDHILAAGLSYRNYGELDSATPVEAMTGKQIWDAYKSGKDIAFQQDIGIENAKRYSYPRSPGWNLDIPDQLRLDRFLEEFNEFKKNGRLPNLITLYLPQDHTGGAVTPRANVADNDLAVGRLVDEVSHSEFWKSTAIFVVEDDPQAGFDHIDGHRSVCLVVSPWTKHGETVSDFYNQTSVLRTILHIFGLPPMNQKDSASPLMTTCFGAEADMRPFTHVPNRVPLDENMKPEEMSAQARYWAMMRSKVDLSEREVQDERGMDIMNRYVWHMSKGDQPYPEQYAGAHGRGLAAKGLRLDGKAADEHGDAD